MKQVIAIASDLHCGSTVGLMPDKWITEEGIEVRPSPGQKWLKKRWDDAWDHVYERGGELISVFNGDLVDGNHHGTHQIWTKHIADQRNAAIECLLEPSNHSVQRYVLRGTPAHVGESGSEEDVIASELGAYKKKALKHLLLTVQNVRFDIAHHGPSPGTRKWTESNGLWHFVRSEMMRYLMEGKEPPHYIVRSHFHQFVPPATVRMFNRGKLYETTGFITPAWQLKSDYGHQVTKTASLSDIGLIYFEIEDGKHSWSYVVKQFDTSDTVEVSNG